MARSRRKRSSSGRTIGLIFLLVLLGVAVFYFWPPDESGGQNEAASDGGEGGDLARNAQEPNAPAGSGSDGGQADPNGPVFPEPPKAGAAEARKAFEQALALRGKASPIRERDLLSKAYFSGALTPQQRQDARERLAYLARITILSPKAHEEDPYDFYYVVKPGDRFAGKKGIEQKFDLHVPHQLLVWVNRLGRAENLRAESRIKLIRGPFHAVVDKSDFTMDVYLQREDLPRVYIRRMAVGLGRNDKTPTGLWRVGLGRKQDRATWYPPSTAQTARRSIPFGDPEYPMGPKGYWIGLESMEEQTKYLGGYGIHGTADPDSVGRAESLGCIRLRAEDMEWLFGTLYEHWSTVRIVE